MGTDETISPCHEYAFILKIHLEGNCGLRIAEFSEGGLRDFGAVRSKE